MTAAQLTIDDIAEQVAAMPHTGVQVDARFGHLRVGDLILADLHSVLSVWPYGGHDLTPAEARDLGAALINWADRVSPLPHATDDRGRIA